MPEDTEDDPREILAALAAQLTQRAELDCPFALTPPPLQLKRTEQAARDRELAARQATLPI